MGQSLKERYASSALYGGNAAYVEFYYEQYLEDPNSVSPEWRSYFRAMLDGRGEEIPHGPVKERFREMGRRAPAGGGSAPEAHADEKQAKASRLVQTFSLRGHQIADIDPLALTERHVPQVLKLEYFGLGEEDMDTEFVTGGLAGTKLLPLREILALVRRIYCGKIGAEFAHVSRARERLWLRERFETEAVTSRLSDEDKKKLLASLTAAEGLERYLHTRYVGQKRFSLEGGESLIPLLDDLIQKGGESGVEEIVIGMAHRGRINVLVNVMGKSPEDLFSEFEGKYDPESLRGSGDVKYHKGFSSDLRTPGGNIHIALAFNPSHLEIVSPVVEGSVRARQERRGDEEGTHILPLLIHGDAAFAGQGVVMETFQMSQTRGFYTGGTVHIVCNNQIGFTTSDPRDARSTAYCSDVAKLVEAPIFHVNADDPEAVILVTRLALEYRQRFRKDVVIDLVCYRRHGHNEADEPAATQPLMYRAIRDHKSARQIYAERLVEEGVLQESDVQAMADDYRQGMDEGRPRVESALGMIGNKYTVDWGRYLGGSWEEEIDTSVSAERVHELAAKLSEVPEEVAVHPRVARILADRERMASGDIPMDWGFAETLAYASLLTEGYQVRLTGQDSGRGTFFHRHAVLHNQSDGSLFMPLQHVSDDQARFIVIDSLLSEEAVMGFEYGFSTTEPNSLVIWEGQFGDFCNGAQVVIDQFISSGEAKWGRLCGLALFLPHGYEGQGPEHSSARLERFLQLCAEHNIQVCVPSTPAQMFHMLRRQMLRSLRKPLIVMTPKSLLRHKQSVSTLADLTKGGFHNLIGETDDMDPSRVRRLVFCAGKVYYDLAESRRKHGIEDVAIARIEQFYPFPIDEYASLIKKYSAASDIIWCQEEPQNQGAWYQIRHRLQEPLTDTHALYYAGRAGAAAPASGIYQMHQQQQVALVEAALGLEDVANLIEDTAIRKKA